VFRRLVLVALLAAPALFAVTALAQSADPDFSGKWRLDPVRSTGDPSHGALIEITQTGNSIEFSYRDGAERFTADGKERQRYQSRFGVAYARARWDKGSLVISTRTILDDGGSQSFTDTERWSLSSENVLSLRTSDGKTLVYTKLPAEANR
jgi:hypothetical protein